MKSRTIEKFKEVFKTYYDKYSSYQNARVEHTTKIRKIRTKSSIQFDVLFATEESFSDWELEADSYLDSKRSPPDVDVLQWWKDHESTYPIVSRMARDILCVPATSVIVERFFSEAAHVVTDLRCSLHDNKIEALVCINMWMKSSLKKEIRQVDI